MNSAKATPYDFLPAFGVLAEGRIDRGSFLLIGPSGCGKTVYSIQFAVNSILNGYPTVFVTTERRPSDLVQYARSFGWELQDSGIISFVDCYSSVVGLEPEVEFSLQTGATLTDLSILIERAAMGQAPKRFVLDSLTQCLLYLKPEVAYKFVQTIIAKMKKMGLLGLFTLIDDALDTHLVNLTRSAFDGVLEMKIVEKAETLERYLRVQTLRGVRHNPSRLGFDISPKGITPLWDGA